MSHRLQVLISKDLDQKLDKASQRQSVSKGEWVRRALEHSLELGAATTAESPLARLSKLNGPTGDIDEMLRDIERGRA
ncbi:MAG: hypothetical protein ABI824_11915 [Acidobacteriota bacterium]